MSEPGKVSELSPAQVRRRIRGLTNCPRGAEEHVVVAVSAADPAKGLGKPADWFVGICCGMAAGILDLSRITPANALAGLVQARPAARPGLSPASLRNLAEHVCQQEQAARIVVTCPLCKAFGSQITPGCGRCVQLAAGDYLVHFISEHLPTPAQKAAMAALGS